MIWQLCLIVANVLSLGSVFWFVRQTNNRMNAVETAVISSVLEETSAELDKKIKARLTINGILQISATLIIPLLAIGGVWQWIPLAFAVMLIVGTVLSAIAVFFIVAIRCDW